MLLLLPATYLWDPYEISIAVGSSIALAICSLDPIRSLDHSLSTRLIAVRTLQTVLFKQALD